MREADLKEQVLGSWVGEAMLGGAPGRLGPSADLLIGASEMHPF